MQTAVQYPGFDLRLVVCRVIAGARDDRHGRAALRERRGDKLFESHHGEFDLQAVQIERVIAVQPIAVRENSGETLRKKRRNQKH